MKKKKINLVSGNNNISVKLSIVPWYLEWLGLMFSRRGKAEALIFEFRKSVNLKIHSLFVNYPFLAVWLNSSGEIIEIRKVLPWRLGVFPSEKFVRLIEIPCSEKYKDICSRLVEDKRFKY